MVLQLWGFGGKMPTFAFMSPTDPLVRADVHEDARGRLFVVPTGAMPFIPRRVFWIRDVPAGTERGGHAHVSCAEVVFAVSGSVEICVDDGRGLRRTFVLDRPDAGLFIGPEVWCELRHFHPGTVCLVLASEAYQPEGYINDYDEFLSRASGGRH